MTATNEEQYEAMVARGHHKDVPAPDTEYVTPTNLSQIYMMRQLGALEKAEWGYTRVNPERAWQASNGHVHVRADSAFDLYCKCFPLPSPPEPSAAEELAGLRYRVKDHRGEIIAAFNNRGSAEVYAQHQGNEVIDATTAGGR